MVEKEAEERFVKSYPEFCYNGKPLSPYWDLWQDGAEFGYNKAIKWHDLLKNPNDLPLRRCIDNDGNVVGLFRNSWDKKSTWYRYDFHEREWWQMETEPIAWCEIPKFEEIKEK